MSFRIVKALPLCRTVGKFSICRISPVRNYWRRNAFSELSSAIQAMENRMRDMDREMSRFLEDFQRTSPVKLPNILSPLEWSRTREIPVIAKDGDGRVFKVELDMQGMEPEDINVTLKDQELSITAKKEEKRSDGSRFVRESKYHYTLPKEVNPEAIRSSLIDGVLTIEAPLPALESKEIPIKIEGSSNSNNSESKKD
ncbi:protein lethal(2)essential for life-like [Argiope bruennichi]|uniref:Heat shock protein beta-1 like protein n=1 Tax=Argiope bruennichi TaxID=94029 RepID=A0A8T0G6T1_ARGBR|nr:protein lethal(2)essential for life-like [Argiope bruennichi]KAF8796943.1 Heat shock protein beta-1 like protein [Argiope bruennichi]